MTHLTATKEKNLQMILSVEQNLQRTLRPVYPNPEFVHRLENRLNNYPRISIERHSNIRVYLIVAVSLLTSLSASWFLWRSLSRKN